MCVFPLQIVCKPVSFIIELRLKGNNVYQNARLSGLLFMTLLIYQISSKSVLCFSNQNMPTERRIVRPLLPYT